MRVTTHVVRHHQTAECHGEGRAGYDVAFPRLGHGFDILVTERGPKGASGCGQIAFKVKSWSTGVLNKDGHFHYPLRVSAYNDLAGKNDLRHYLALCKVPDRRATGRTGPSLDFSEATARCLSCRPAAVLLVRKSPRSPALRS